jgi:hypothetical protein
VDLLEEFDYQLKNYTALYNINSKDLIEFIMYASVGPGAV